MRVYILEEATKQSPKKYTAIRLNPTMKRISFGAKGYEDYTQHGNDERKKNYLSRHKETENWNDPDTAGFWSRWLLWGEPTIDKSILAIEKRFKIAIVKAF